MNPFQQMPGTSKGDLHAIRIFFTTIIGGAVAFSMIGVTLNVVKRTGSPVKEYENIILGVAIVIGLICLVVAKRGYDKGITIAKDSLISLPGKLNQYRVTLIRYMALWEGPPFLRSFFFL